MEEEEKENLEYKTKLSNGLKASLTTKFAEIETVEFNHLIEEKALNSNFICEDYIDRISRIKTFNHIKDQLESKIVLVRVDFYPFEIIMEDIKIKKVS